MSTRVENPLEYKEKVTPATRQTSGGPAHWLGVDMTERICDVDSCERLTILGRRMCQVHIARLWRNGHLDLLPRPSVEERFFAKLQKQPDGCWLWTGSHLPAGYGVFQDGGRKRIGAHRWSYEHFVGPIPDGLEIDHLCRRPACVNPEHLEPVTHRENCLRSESVPARNARKTHCPQGHEYSPENTLKEGRGRRCRTCRNAQQRRAWGAKHMTAKPEL